MWFAGLDCFLFAFLFEFFCFFVDLAQNKFRRLMSDACSLLAIFFYIFFSGFSDFSFLFIFGRFRCCGIFYLFLSFTWHSFLFEAPDLRPVFHHTSQQSLQSPPLLGFSVFPLFRSMVGHFHTLDIGWGKSNNKKRTNTDFWLFYLTFYLFLSRLFAFVRFVS